MTIVCVHLAVGEVDALREVAQPCRVVDAYVLVYAALLVTGGVLGDRRGRKGVFVTGVTLFGAGALLCALAPSVGVLLAGRVLQGLGPALLVPGSLTIVRAIFEHPRQRALAIGLWSTSSGLALAVGPALGGLLVAGLGWRWVFLFNVPLVAVLISVAARFVPRLPRNPVRHRFDWPGAILCTAGIGALTFATIEGQTLGWTSAPVLGGFAAGLTALGAFVGWERRRAEPLVDVTLFARAPFAAATLAGLVVFFAFVGAIVYFSVYFQQVHDETHENGPRNALRASRGNARETVSVGHGEWVVDGVSCRGDHQVRQVVCEGRQDGQGQDPRRGRVGDRLVA